MRRKLSKSIILLMILLLTAGCAAVSLPLSALNGAPAAQVSPIEAAQGATPTPAGRPAANVPVASANSLTALQGTYEQIYETVNPSVVNIQVSVGSGFVLGGDGQGSGFVWDTQGHIVTNNHVVEDAEEILVVFSDGSEADAELVGADPESDLAVIQVVVPASQLRPVTLADSSQVKVGQLAIAIGNPYGLSGTMTEGIISGLSRSLPVNETLQSGGSYTIPDIIQTDAAINPGNSGGVLLNAQGQVIGVTAAIRTNTNANTGIGFVIPSNIVSRVVPVLIEDGRYQHPRLGISGLTLTRRVAEAVGLDEDQKGVLVIDVVANGPAQRAGLLGGTLTNVRGQQVPTGGDVITAVDGRPVIRFEDLTSYIFNNTQVGQTISLTVLRQGREQTIDLTLGVLSQLPGQ